MIDKPQDLDEILNNYGLEIHHFKLYEPSAEWDAERHKAKQAILDWHQQEIAKARLDAQLVFAATLRAAGGEVTLSKKELMSSNSYRVTRYDNNLDGSATFHVETLKELEAEL